MMNRNFDMSNYIKRQSNRVAAQSFISRMQSPNNEPGSAPYLGISSYSIINEIRPGSMTEYTRSAYGGCELVSPGCPQPPIDPRLMIPSSVGGVQISYGSIILSWQAPNDDGKGPFTYEITPYLNGVSLPSITTNNTTYKFEDLETFKPYTFNIVVLNNYGKSQAVSSGDPVIMPPSGLGACLSGSGGIGGDMNGCIKYLQGNAIDFLLKYIAANNLGPTRSSRIVYLWSAAVAQAWNWVSSGSPITGLKDGWDWTANKKVILNDNDKILWFALVVDHITSVISGQPYTSKFTYNSDLVTSVKKAGLWNEWANAFNNWLLNRNTDGYLAATTTMPTSSANWGQTIVVDGVTETNINQLPNPSQWTRLTVQGKKQGYLTWDWDSVRSTCLSESDEVGIEQDIVAKGLGPKSGQAREDEVNWVVKFSQEMGDDNEVSNTRKLLAEFWAGGPGTVSPPCMFVWMWCQYVRGLTGVTADKLVYSLLDLGIHLFEGGRVTWRLKKKYMEARPIQEVRKIKSGKFIKTWNGSNVKGDLWVPYQEANFVTPPFADFPSGHSHFSKAFALTMTSWFGNFDTNYEVDYCNPKLICPLLKEGSIRSRFGVFNFTKGSSSIQPGVIPSVDSQLTFTNWEGMATDAGMSRLYGGIHCYTAHEASQQAAELVDQRIVASWGINKSI